MANTPSEINQKTLQSKGTFYSPVSFGAGILVLVIVLSCGRPEITFPEVFVSGKVQAGPVSRARVDFYEINKEAERGRLIARTETDQDGYFSTRLPNIQQSSFVLARASGGSYLDEASQEIVVIEPHEYFQSLFSITGPTKLVPITPLTNMVTEGALKNRIAHRTLEDALTSFSSVVEFSTGLFPGDLELLPASPSATLSAESGEKRLDAVLTSLSQVLQDREVRASEKNAAYANIAANLARSGHLELTLKNIGTGSGRLETQEASGEKTTLIPELAQKLNDQGVLLQPIELNPTGFGLTSFCGAQGQLLTPGQVCCNPAGCDNGCTYSNPSQGETCGDEEEQCPLN